MLRKVCLPIAVALCLGIATPSHAAVDMFLELTGIPGESKDSTHKDDIDVLAWSWGMSNPATVSTGGGGISSGRPNIQDLSLTKWADKSSAKIMDKLCRGGHITEAKLYVRKAGETPIEYIVITLTDVMVTSVSTGGSGGEDRLTENLSLAFKKVKFEYTTQKEDGSAGPIETFEWDLSLATN